MNNWETVRNQLRTFLPSHIYFAFVDRTNCLHFDSNGVELEFDDSFTKENFEEKCLPLLKEILRRNLQSDPEIRLKTTPLQRELIPDSQTVTSYYEHPQFDPKYSFESFVVGSSNQFAHAACEAVAKQPGRCYNPLFIFGGAGLGKTHLLKSIGNETSRLDRNLKVIYVTTESFTNELIQAIRLDRMRQFREKYRTGCDVLLIDDVHFLAGKDRTQEEFFYTFNYLHELRKQIVITSDRYPKDIQGLENRLQTRFEWGLVADVQPPEIETRAAILKNKAEELRILLPDEVAQFVAEHVKQNVRELEGALHRLQAYASMTGQPISFDLAAQIFKDISPRTKTDVSAESIIRVVALHFGLKTTDLKSDKRIRKLTYPRQVSMYLIRKYLGLSFPEIGRMMGGKDHTTVMHGVQKIAEQLRNDTETIHHITSLEATIR